MKPSNSLTATPHISQGALIVTKSLFTLVIIAMAASAQAQFTSCLGDEWGDCTIPDPCSAYITHLELTGLDLKVPNKVLLDLVKLERDAPNDPAQCAALDKQFAALNIPGKLHLMPVHTPTLEEQSERDMQLLQQAIGDGK